MPMARPPRAGSVPPGYLAASSANTGRTRNRPSMRAAKTAAREPLARRSTGVMLEETGETEAVFTRLEGAGTRPPGGPANQGLSGIPAGQAARHGPALYHVGFFWGHPVFKKYTYAQHLA